MADKVGLVKSLARGSRRQLAYVWLNGVHARTTQIALTGSYGKTSTTHIISSVLRRAASVLTTDVNLDTLYNVPITCLRLRGHRYVVFELGIDHPNEMDVHLQIVKPHVSVITGIAPVHADQEHLGSVEAIITEKRKLIECLGPSDYAILNRDDSNVRAMSEHTKAQVLWYGVSEGSHYRAEDIRLSLDGSQFTLVTPNDRYPVTTPLLGQHGCANALAAAAVSGALGLPDALTVQSLAQIPRLPGRFDVEMGPRNTLILNDALRSNLASMKAGLTFLSGLEYSGRRVAILGEMGEIGDLEVSAHQEVGVQAATARIDYLVCVGELTRHIAQAALDTGLPRDQVCHCSSVREAATAVNRILQAGDLIYVKGSRLRHMERILLLLRGVSVECNVPICPLYVDCSDCRYREVGYPL